MSHSKQIHLHVETNFKKYFFFQFPLKIGFWSAGGVQNYVFFTPSLRRLFLFFSPLLESYRPFKNHYNLSMYLKITQYKNFRKFESFRFKYFGSQPKKQNYQIRYNNIEFGFRPSPRRCFRFSWWLDLNSFLE